MEEWFPMVGLSVSVCIAVGELDPNVGGAVPIRMVGLDVVGDTDGCPVVLGEEDKRDGIELGTSVVLF
jgi:hypothetical protein